MNFIEKNELDKILRKLNDNEAQQQYSRHLPYMLSGLDDKEEYKSRLAFADTYSMELYQIHEAICKAYGLPDEFGNGEFAYLEDIVLREEMVPKYSRLLEMMKDYASYRYESGKLEKQAYEKLLNGEKQAEQKFRKQELTAEDKSFLLDNGTIHGVATNGVRECRKWMLRNCNKSGVANDTGSKRGFTDTFCKRPAAAQCAMLYQVEKGYYKFGGETEMQMQEALQADYIPSLKNFKDKMVKSKYNPYNQYLKIYGEYFYWNKMEQAMKKIDGVYPEYARQEHPQNVNMGRSVALHGENPLQKMSDEKVWKKFKEWQKDYVKLMDAYINDQTAENRHKLKKMGNTMQNYAKLVKLRGGFEDRWDHSQEIYSFAAVTRDMDKSLDKVSGPELKKVFHERMTDWSDLGAVGEWGASLVFSGGKWVANNLGGVLSTMNAEKNIVEQMQEAKGIDNVAIGFRWAGLLVSAYTTVKEGFMSAVTFGRRKKAMGIKKMNKEQPVEQQEKESAAKEGAAKEAAVKDNAVNDNTAIKESAKKEAVKENAVINGGKKEKAPEKKTEAKPGVNAAAEQVRPPEDQDQKQINAMAKLSKKSNAKKSWSHLSKFGFAAAGLGFTIAGFFGIACLPVTIAAGAVASVGVGVKYAVDYYRNKNTAKKAVDTQAKLEEENYKGQLDDKGHKIRYIDAKVAERRKMLIEKRSRFEGTNQSLKVLDEYIADDKKLKDRIRQNIAAENGKISIYSYADQVKRDYAMEAYRHVFLKDPDGPIDEENLLSEADVKKYCSLNKKDLADTKQDAKEARNRIMYRDLLQAEGLSVEAPKDVHEAKKLFEEKKKAKQRSEDKNAVQNKKKPVLH